MSILATLDEITPLCSNGHRPSDSEKDSSITSKCGNVDIRNYSQLENGSNSLKKTVQTHKGAWLRNLIHIKTCLCRCANPFRCDAKIYTLHSMRNYISIAACDLIIMNLPLLRFARKYRYTWEYCHYGQFFNGTCHAQSSLDVPEVGINTHCGDNCPVMCPFITLLIAHGQRYFKSSSKL